MDLTPPLRRARSDGAGRQVLETLHPDGTLALQFYAPSDMNSTVAVDRFDIADAAALEFVVINRSASNVRDLVLRARIDAGPDSVVSTRQAKPVMVGGKGLCEIQAVEIPYWIDIAEAGVLWDESPAWKTWPTFRELEFTFRSLEPGASAAIPCRCPFCSSCTSAPRGARRIGCPPRPFCRRSTPFLRPAAASPSASRGPRPL